MKRIPKCIFNLNWELIGSPSNVRYNDLHEEIKLMIFWRFSGKTTNISQYMRSVINDCIMMSVERDLKKVR